MLHGTLWGASYKSKPSSELARTYYNNGLNAVSEARAVCFFVVVVVVFCCAGALQWPVLGLEPRGSLSHITAPVKGGLLAGWSRHREYVAFTVNHNAASLSPDCTGGSRDLP